MGRLQGKVALITGAAKGLGQVMAETFAKEGAIVYAADMAPLSYTAKNVVGVTLNVTDVEMVKKVVADIKEKHGKIDVLVNNAGITADKLTVRMDDAMWDRVIAVNLKASLTSSVKLVLSWNKQVAVQLLTFLQSLAFTEILVKQITPRVKLVLLV